MKVFTLKYLSKGKPCERSFKRKDLDKAYLAADTLLRKNTSWVPLEMVARLI